MTIFVHTLGRIVVANHDGTTCDALLAQPKRLALFVHLAVEPPDRWRRRDELLAMFWPELDAERARSALRKALHFLRQAVGEGVIVTRGDEVAVDASAVWTDARALRNAIDTGDPERATALYEGEFLPSFHISGADGFERWTANMRDRLHSHAADAAWTAAARRWTDGDFTGACTLADRAARLAPDSEVAAHRFIELLAKSGDRTAAAAAYREFTARLQRELGVRPSAATDRAVHALVSAPIGPEATGPATNARHLSSTEAPADFARSESQPATQQATQQASRPAAAMPASGAARAQRSRAWRRQLLVATAASVLAVGGFGFWTARREPPVAVGLVAVMPFDVKAAPDLRYLSDGLALLLGMRLDGTGDIRTVDPRTLLKHAIVPDSAAGVDLTRARAEAQWFGAGLFVTGSVIRAGDVIELHAELYDRTRGDAPVHRAQVSGPERDLLPLVDALASRLVAARLRSSGATIAGSAALTTMSLPALKAWLRGEAHYRSGQFGDATSAFEDAVREDTTFALAYFRLAVAANWAAQQPKVLPAASRAAELAARLPARTRTLLQAFHATRMGLTADAETLYERVLAEDPNDSEAWFELAEARFHVGPMAGRSIASAREAFERVRQLDPHHVGAIIHLARIAAGDGNLPRLDTLTRYALAAQPDGARSVELLLLRGFSLGDASALTDARASVVGLESLAALWRAAEYTGALVSAGEFARASAQRTSDPMLQASFLFLAAHAAAGRGEVNGSSMAAREFATFAPRSATGLHALLLLTEPGTDSSASRHGEGAIRAALGAERDAQPRGRPVFSGGGAYDDALGPLRSYYAALLALRAGDLHGARRSLAQLTAQAGAKPVSILLRARVHLDVLFDLRAGAPARALARFDSLDARVMSEYASPTPFIPRAALHLAAATALEQLGRPADALARLNAVPEDFGFDLAFLPEVHRRRAALLARLGRSAEAARERAWLAAFATPLTTQEVAALTEQAPRPR